MTIRSVLAEHAREARSLIRTQGLASYIRRWPVYLSHFFYQHEEFCIWRSDLSCLSGSFVPRIDGCDFRAIAEPGGLDELVAGGLTADPSFDLEEARWMLKGHVVGGLVLVRKELASWAWMGMNEDHRRYFVNPPPRKLDYASEAYAARAYTLPRFRGLGLDTYGGLKRLEYLREKGKSAFVLVTLKDNEPAIRVQKKLGSRAVGEIRVRKVLLHDFRTEKWNDGR